MRDAIGFLLDRAEELRELAQSAPDIAAELRRMADELEDAAAELRRGQRRGAQSG
jgi:prefoldin subunit 5